MTDSKQADTVSQLSNEELKPGDAVDIGGRKAVVISVDENVEPPPDVCHCRDNQVCHLCPESKKQRVRAKLERRDPHNYIRPARRHPNVPTKRETRIQELEIRAFFGKKLGRQVTNKDMAFIRERAARGVSREQLVKEMEVDSAETI